MAKLLGLDVGSKTIGVAVGDDSVSIAFPRETILRSEGWRKDMQAIRSLIEENAIDGIVIGMPLMMDGSRGVQAEKVALFVERLRGSIRIPVWYQDERLTTSQAERVLLEANRKRAERKNVIDSLAACLLLQAFIDGKVRERETIEDNGDDR